MRRNSRTGGRGRCGTIRSDFRTTVGLLVRFLIGLLLALLAFGVMAQALVIESPWLREPAPGQGSIAIYLRLVNRSEAPWVLSGARVDGAQSAALHQHVIEGGLMGMRPAGSVTVPPGGELVLEPGGYHLMVFGLVRAPRAGEKLPFCLDFASGTQQCAQAVVRGLEE